MASSRAARFLPFAAPFTQSDNNSNGQQRLQDPPAHSKNVRAPPLQKRSKIILFYGSPRPLRCFHRNHSVQFPPRLHVSSIHPPPLSLRVVQCLPSGSDDALRCTVGVVDEVVEVQVPRRERPRGDGRKTGQRASWAKDGSTRFMSSSLNAPNRGRRGATPLRSQEQPCPRLPRQRPAAGSVP